MMYISRQLWKQYEWCGKVTGTKNVLQKLETSIDIKLLIYDFIWGVKKIHSLVGKFEKKIHS